MVVWTMGAALAAEPCAVPGGRTTVRYVTASGARAEEAKLAEAELREPGPTPDGGYVVVRIERRTIEGADPSTQTVVLESDGQEIGRVQPLPAVPKLPGEDLFWSSTFRVDVPEPPAFPVQLHVADRPSAERCTWSLHPDGDVRQGMGVCRWPNGITEVRSEREWVWIDGETIPVEGRAAWSVLMDDLTDCGMTQAAIDLDKWRQKRRLTNIMLIVSAGTFYPIVSVPFIASGAGRSRKRLEQDLREWTPASEIGAEPVTVE